MMQGRGTSRLKHAVVAYGSPNAPVCCSSTSDRPVMGYHCDMHCPVTMPADRAGETARQTQRHQPFPSPARWCSWASLMVSLNVAHLHLGRAQALFAGRRVRHCNSDRRLPTASAPQPTRTCKPLFDIGC